MTRAEITAPADFVPFASYDVEQPIGARFEKIARIHATRTAILTESESITYAELNRRANRIAHAIGAAGTPEPGSRIVVFLEKGVAGLAAILGVLKAGHAYVPVDPAFPAARNEHILADSGAALILSDTRNLAAAQLLAAGRAPLLDLDAIAPDAPDTDPGITIAPDALAYLIYTSGSTGRPKGVMQNHRNALHGCMRRTNLQKIAPSDRMTLFYSASVMGSVYCIFGALLNGACLLPYDIRDDGLDALGEWLRRHRVTVYHSVASVFRSFANSASSTPGIYAIRLVIFGGERVLASDIDLVRGVFSPRCEFFTGLGSTETGTIRHLIIGPDTTFDGRIVPIGYPVEGMEVLLLDEEGRPVAPGEVGEIAVRSRYVALGYWNLPEVSARAFRPDPVDASARIYHTGDMGCLHPDGLLEHRGRKDFQVKIRGFRVEVADVEAALAQGPGVAEGVAVAREIDGENQLVAYVAARPGAQLRVRELRCFLAARLPYYMVPSIFVGLAAIPRTPNNKVDRLSLPLPGPDNELPSDQIIAPEGEVESTLVAICRDLLHRDAVGVNQNFFELGGHSLSATQLVARVQKRLGVRLPMRAVFEAADLRTLAATIGSATTGAPADAAELVPTPPGTRIPLSFAQRRMWLIDRMYPGSAAYNISNTVRIEGPLDTDALERALGDMVARHEILRTVFPADEEGPWQETLPFAPLRLAQTDLRSAQPGEREALAREAAHAALRRPHDLTRGPLFHAELLRLDECVHVLVLVFNHIIYDNIWSSGIFFRELGAFYAAHTSRSAPALPALPYQFRDYAVWQQAVARATNRREDLDYWRNRLAGSPAVLEMPTDRPRPARPTFRGGQIPFEIPAEVRAALADLAAAESSTLFMVLLAAWQVLLHRYSGQDDILVGTPTGRRHLAATEEMIGLFINTLVLRTDCSGNPGFRALLRQVRATTIDAFTHDEVPFEDIVAATRADRDTAVTPLFQHLFIHRNATHAPWTLPGLAVRPVEAHPGGAKFDLTLSVLETEARLTGTLEYSLDLYDEATARRLVANYATLLASIARDPGARLGALDLVAPAERCLLLGDGDASAAPYPTVYDTHRLFESRAAGRSDALAVVSGGRRLSYGELNVRANQIAHALIRMGIGRDSLVAVCLNRSPELIAALLGVLKAGGAYVPLDPGFPADRLAYMIEDSGATVFISESGVVEGFPDLKATPLLLAPDAPVFASADTGNPDRPCGDDALAYVIYTSGSTGRPKGVQLVRRALGNFLLSMQREPGLSAVDVVHSLTTVSFDIAALEIFLPLISGATVVIEPREVSLDPARLLASIEATGATVLQATPVTWRMLLDHGWTGTPRLRVLCGGEAMGADLAARLLATSCEVWNLYGPTETTIWSTVQRVRNRDDASFVGRPIANTQLYVASPALALQPAGAPGELLIGGDGLARGYHQRAQLTGEKFIVHPFAPSGRVYRTGDLVRRRIDGSIEFLGRMDNQVKLRGFRIELGEIEAHLADCDGVQRAVVIAREDTPGDKRLVAYVVPRPGSEPAPATLRERLRSQLPEYMVPSAFVLLGALPLTPNNKVDRKALPAPEPVSDAPAARVFEPPATPDEQLLAQIFSELLKTPRIARTDNFFDLGGNSLMAVRAQARVARATGRRLELRRFFEAANLADLASSLGPRAPAPNEETGTL